MPAGKVYLIPTVLHDDAPETIPAYITDAIRACDVFFVENKKTTRRYIKKLWKDFVVDDQQWFTIHKAEEEVSKRFLQLLQEGHTIGIVSEAGCPGIADPGQLLVQAAQKSGYIIKPLVGPSSILLALMASGMNGQCFQFHGYLPIDAADRKKKIRELENQSRQQSCTQIFIETPYRNNGLIKDVLTVCSDTTRFCIAVDITAPAELIRTKTVKEWKQQETDIHKRLAIFLLQA